MNIEDLVRLVARDKECKVLAPKESIPAGIGAPEDLIRFYALTGGVEMFPARDFGFRIVSPSEFIPANPILKGQFYLKHKVEFDRDDSARWYVIARGTRTEECVTIDLNPSRLGWCYDSFWDVYATPDSKIVARSFSQLIERLYTARGASLFWNDRSFDLGKAYDWKSHQGYLNQ